MTPAIPTRTDQTEDQWIPETQFGKWFLSTNVWYRWVLNEAIRDVRQLVGDRCPKDASMLEIGCGQGQSFTLLEEYFSPQSITAIDIDPQLLEVAKSTGNDCQCQVNVEFGSAKKLNIPDNTFDFVSCHQLIHHISFREEALQEFFRVLKPGGMLLLSESCLPFLNVYWVRWFFRHPKMVQKTAEGYRDMVKEANFKFTEDDVLESTPWWSKRDFGLLEKYGLQFWKSKTAEISIVATKPEG